MDGKQVNQWVDQVSVGEDLIEREKGCITSKHKSFLPSSKK